ncbi:hypothetical protein [Desulfococcus sp.]|uniref:hypothetical protein n=1 Tax=Desulfococcus sp. TaxID=2025834 RepID=UPI0035946DE6
MQVTMAFYEIHGVRQIAGEPKRRWFCDDFFDLILWLDDGGGILGFQLCYNKQGDQHALTWHAGSGYLHTRVDEGESRPGKFKASPVLMPNGPFSKEAIAVLFLRASRPLERWIVDAVHAKILQY